MLLGISSPCRYGGAVGTAKLWLRLATGTLALLLTSDEEVDCRIGECENDTNGVKQCEVKLLSEITHVLGKRHASDEQSLHSAHVSIMVVGVVQVSKRPGLDY
jgi:hypothetical protein